MLLASWDMTLLSMCETHWVYKHEAILRFKEIYVAIIHDLQELEVSVKRDAGPDFPLGMCLGVAGSGGRHEAVSYTHLDVYKRQV